MAVVICPTTPTTHTTTHYEESLPLHDSTDLRILAGRLWHHMRGTRLGDLDHLRWIMNRIVDLSDRLGSASDPWPKRLGAI